MLNLNFPFLVLTTKDLDRGLHSNESAISALSSSGELKKVFRTFLEQFPSKMDPLEKGVQLVRRIKEKGEHHLYVLSNFHKESFEKVRSNNEFFSLFDGLCVSAHVGWIKPEKEIYFELKKIIEDKIGKQVEFSECLFIDDMEENIVAAKELGMYGVICDDHENVERYLKELNIL